MVLFIQKTFLLLCSQIYSMFLLWPLVSGTPQRHVNNSCYIKCECMHMFSRHTEENSNLTTIVVISALCALVMRWDTLGFPEMVAVSASCSGCHRGSPAHISWARLPLDQFEVLSPLSKWGSHL